MIEVSIDRIVNSIAALTALSQAQRSIKKTDNQEEFKPLDMNRSHSLSKIMAKCEEEAKLYEKIRVEKAQELGELLEQEVNGVKNPYYKFTPENGIIFQEENKNLLAKIVTFDFDKPLLKDYMDLSIDAAHMLRLDWLFQE